MFGDEGLDLDYFEARLWYNKAANGGSVEAMSQLAVMYNQGMGGSRNFRHAARWYQQAIGGECSAAQLKRHKHPDGSWEIIGHDTSLLKCFSSDEYLWCKQNTKTHFYKLDPNGHPQYTKRSSYMPSARQMSQLALYRFLNSERVWDEAGRFRDGGYRGDEIPGARSFAGKREL